MFKVFQFQENKINVFGKFDKLCFYGNQISKSIGYIDTCDSIKKHVWETNKMTVEEYIDNMADISKLGDLTSKPGENFKKINSKTVLLKMAGVFQLIYCSKLPNAVIFEAWFRKEILQNLRQKVLQPLELTRNQFVILNESDLQIKTVDYLRTFCPDVLFHASMGELQTDSNKRIMSKKMGYTKGMFDLVIYENSKQHNGLSIEFKTPKCNGVLSEHQQSMKLKLEERGYLTIISDNYDKIIFEINNYLSTRRFKCCHCNIKCKSTENLKTHILNFHKK